MHRVHALTRHVAVPGAGAGADSASASTPTPTPTPTLTRAPTGGWVLTMHPGVPEIDPRPSEFSLKDKTVFITGASRGIGLAIAVRCARDGARVALAAKTTEEQPTLEGTIFTAARAVEAAGGRALPVKCDVRDEESVAAAVRATVDAFGGIDVLVNCASAIQLTGTLETTVKRFDLMHQVDARATFVVTRTAIPHLIESAKRGRNPHVLTISPPLESILEQRWFQNHAPYALCKFGMSVLTNGWAAEFKADGIAFNALWPRTAIATAAVKNLLGGDPVMQASRSPEAMSDAAHAILTSDAKKLTGKFLIDDVVLACVGVSLKEMEKRYNVTPGTHPSDLAPDFFC